MVFDSSKDGDMLILSSFEPTLKTYKRMNQSNLKISCSIQNHDFLEEIPIERG